MKCERYSLPYGEAGYMDAYLLDSGISSQVERKWPAMIICPGGGYLVTTIKEGEGAAMPFLSHGFHCFVVKYSTYLADRKEMINGQPKINEKSQYPVQVLELMHALHLIHEHAEEWNVDETRIFATGFSAGGHIVGTLATRWNDKELIDCLDFTPEPEELKLTGAILSYPMLDCSILNYGQTKEKSGSTSIDIVKKCLFGTTAPTEDQLRSVELKNYISSSTCPLFVWHTNEDELINSHATTTFVAELQKVGVPCEYHLFGKGPHGLACANRYYAKSDDEIDDEIALWIPLALNWLHRF